MGDFDRCELDSPLLSKRVKGFLKEKRIYTIAQLCRLSYRDFERHYGLGKGCLENVIAFLKLCDKELYEMPPENYFRKK